jgi:hypothetical protein
LGALPALALCETLPRSPLPRICGSSSHAPSTLLCMGSVVVMLPPSPPPVGAGLLTKLCGQALLSSCGTQTPSLQCDDDALLVCVVPSQHTHTILRVIQPCPAQVLLLLHAVRWCHLRHRPAPTHRPHRAEHGRVRGFTCIRRCVSTRDPRTRRLYTPSYSHTPSHTHRLHTHTHSHTHRLHAHTHSLTHTHRLHTPTHSHTLTHRLHTHTHSHAHALTCTRANLHTHGRIRMRNVRRGTYAHAPPRKHPHTHTRAHRRPHAHVCAHPSHLIRS